ncbi:MAG: LysR family transcriptional regulator [Actinobacteria bacterium]|nr:LysR family transcriptional regulator [Actinomycetota bacterium]
MDVRQLRCFVAVADELHFGRAAARLHVAGPAVSQTIRSIENELGLVLFDRNNRRVELTDAGRLLLDEARAVIDRFDGMSAAMARLRSGQGGQVRIGAVPALPPRLIPRLLAEFAVDAESVDVVVRALPPGRDAREALDASDLDIALVRGEVTATGIGAVVVAREPVGVAIPASHPLASHAEITATDLNGTSLVSFTRASDPEQYDRIYNTLAAAGLTDLRVVSESHQGAVEASMRLVESGVGLSLKLRSEVDAFASVDVTWRPLAKVMLEVVVSAAWRLDRITPALARVLPLLAPNEQPGRR